LYYSWFRSSSLLQNQEKPVQQAVLVPLVVKPVQQVQQAELAEQGQPVQPVAPVQQPELVEELWLWEPLPVQQR
jgi:hypothetical protein